MSELTTLVGETTLKATTCWCGIWFAAPSNLVRMHDENGTGLFCPLGHESFRKKTDAQLLREENERLAVSKQALADQLAATERSLAATRGVVTRVKNRVKAGVCPFCTRTFTNVARHMETKHADEHAPL